jgi:hypothetical protein
VIFAFAFVASPWLILVLGLISSLSCTITLLLHEFSKATYKEGHLFIFIIITTSMLINT